MGHTQPKDDEHDELLPSDDAAESVLSSNEPEPQGIADGEELVLAQLDELHDGGGLDVEAGVEGGLDITTMVDGDDPEEAHDDTRADASFEDASLNDASGIDASGDEDGWMSESEGDTELYQSDFSEDEPDHADDGGADGTDDPLHDGIDEDALPPLHSHDAEDTLVDEIEQELLREIALEG